MLSPYLLLALTACGLQTLAKRDVNPTNGFRNAQLGTSAGKAANCVSGQVPVSVSATTKSILFGEPQNQTVVTDFFQQLFQTNPTLVARSVGGNVDTKGTFYIDATLCVPANPAAALKVQTIQVLTHGVGLDKSYWDIAPGYSHVDAAAQAGYATLAYNRLGVGASDHPDPLQVVQAATDVEILHGLIGLVKSGSMGARLFKHIVGVGHSYGSIVQLAVNAKYPSDVEAAVLTGFVNALQNLPYAILANNPAIANQNDPARFGNLPNGYLVHDTRISIQLPFFRFPFFDNNIFEINYAAKNTYTIGQEITLPSIITPAPSFTGPVDVVIGQNDFTFCHGDCTSPPGLAAGTISSFYPAAGAGSDSYLVPNAGHVINAHYSAPDGFTQIMKFLQSHSF